MLVIKSQVVVQILEVVLNFKLLLLTGGVGAVKVVVLPSGGVGAMKVLLLSSGGI